jgi:hypothetical protein
MLETALEEVLQKDQVTKKFFLGVFARDELPLQMHYPSCFVLNTAPRNNAGEHWLAFYYDKNGHCDFFDSYGMPPANFDLEIFLNESANSWKYNKQRIQGSSALCGHYCILFLLFRSRSKTINFYSNFDENFSQNDKKIKNLIKEFD